MKDRESLFLAAIGLGWFSVDSEGRIWRHVAMAGGSRKGSPGTPKRLDSPTRAEKASSGPNGYPKVMFTIAGRREAVYAHRIVWMVANARTIPTGMEVNHKDGNKRRPHPDNLELVTHTENTLHAIRVLGRKMKEQRGSKNTSAKLDEGKVLQIRSMCAAGTMPQREIADLFRVSQSTVAAIYARQTWSHVVD